MIFHNRRESCLSHFPPLLEAGAGPLSLAPVPVGALTRGVVLVENLSPLSIFPPLAVSRTALVERSFGKGGDAPDFAVAVVVVIIEQTVVQVVRGVGLGD